MIKHFHRSALAGLVIALLLGAGVLSSTLNSCATLGALTNIARIQFKINGVEGVRLCGIDITNKHSISDFSIMDGVSLASAFGSGHFPLTFTVDVAAKNPNASTASTIVNQIKVSSFPWTLYLNNQSTISGNIGAPIGVPVGGTTTIIPLSASVDLKQFFGNQGYAQVVQVATALSGNGGASHVQLKAKPTLSTPLGTIPYPNELTIVNTQFSS
ncbi:MAG TPA: LEA type 2 family protein [Candidatus Kapabacteria bacterium]|jgi:hypothetical protein